MKHLAAVFLFSLFLKMPVAANSIPATLRGNISDAGISFLENRGQMRTMEGTPADFVLFKAEAPGIDVYVTTKGLTYVLFEAEEEEKEMESRDQARDPFPGQREVGRMVRWQKITMTLEGADLSQAGVIREYPVQGVNNYYFPGNPEGIRGVQSFRRLTFRNIYPGIDWIVYSDAEKGFKYDFYVHAGADASLIKWKCSTPYEPAIDENGALIMRTRFGTVKENAPKTYLQTTGAAVKSGFVVGLRECVGEYWNFVLQVKVGGKNIPASETMVIDPQVTWSTLIGGNSADGIHEIDTDSSGNLFAIGYSFSTNYPLQNAGTFYSNAGLFVILKFSNSGAKIWTTYFGSGDYSSMALDCDLFGNVFVCGALPGGHSVPLLNAGSYFQGMSAGMDDAFISKFDNNGQLLWSTVYGGSAYDRAVDISTDASGNLYVCGVTTSTNFPLQNSGGFFQSAFTATSCPPGFLLKFDNGGNRLWATLVQIRPYAVANDVAGNLFVAGLAGAYSVCNTPLANPGSGAYFQAASADNSDLFINKFSNSGQLLWGTYYGGNGWEYLSGMVTDNNGNLFIGGITSATNFPVYNAGTFYQPSYAGGYNDAFVLKFNNAGVRQWATYFGGTGNEGFASRDDLAADRCGNVYLSLLTSTNNIITQAACDGGFSVNSHSGGGDAFLARFTNNGTLDWATYFGGNAAEMREPLAVDPYGNLFVSGEWNHEQAAFNPSTYPLVNAAGSYYDGTHNGDDDSFITKFGNAGPAVFSYQNVCVGSVSALSPISMSGFTPGGTFAGSAGLNVNSVTGVINVSATPPGVYTVTYVPAPGSSTCGCAYTISTTATISIALLSASVPSMQICAGSQAVLPPTVVSSSPVTYTWLPAGPNTPVWIVTPSVSTVYTLAVGNSEGCNATAYSSVTVNQLPQVTVTGQLAGCAGSQFLLTASGALSYYWNTGCLSSTCAINPNQSATYTVTGTNAAGCVNSATVHIQVETCASVEDRELSDNFLRVYPNPAHDEFILEVLQAAEVYIDDDAGRLVFTRKLQSNEKCTVRDLPPGTYIVRLRDGDRVHAIKLVVQ